MVKAPWTCTAQVFSLFFHSKPDKSTNGLATIAYSPLERDSYFASSEAGQFIGGPACFTVFRYSDTPVGPYDELVIIPGAFTYSTVHKGRKVQRTNPRNSRIYVSQKHTMYNGRLNWNIPKHLARFEWEDLLNGAKRVKIFPQESEGDGIASSMPFFQVSFKTIPFVPKFPFSTAWSKYMGLDFTLAQPPIPQGRSEEGVGTEKWCALETTQASRQTQDEEGKFTTLFENFWPGLGRWHLGVRMNG